MYLVSAGGRNYKLAFNTRKGQKETQVTKKKKKRKATTLTRRQETDEPSLTKD